MAIPYNYSAQISEVLTFGRSDSGPVPHGQMAKNEQSITAFNHVYYLRCRKMTLIAKKINVNTIPQHARAYSNVLLVLLIWTGRRTSVMPSTGGKPSVKWRMTNLNFFVVFYPEVDLYFFLALASGTGNLIKLPVRICELTCPNF